MQTADQNLLLVVTQLGSEAGSHGGVADVGVASGVVHVVVGGDAISRKIEYLAENECIAKYI